MEYSEFMINQAFLRYDDANETNDSFPIAVIAYMMMNSSAPLATLLDFCATINCEYYHDNIR
ncbi:MAG: hypothetical protein F6K40_12290 [Okeania sp. SIO3I5]|nr:hypothetical protein [Okeania sp. SIO3I5]